MSHEIGKTDKQQGIEMAWHGLTEVLKEILLVTCFLAGWDVYKRPLFRPVVKPATDEQLREQAQRETESARNEYEDDSTKPEKTDADWTDYSNRVFAELCAKRDADVARGFEETSACEVVCTDDQSIVIGKPVDCDSYSLLTNKGFLAIVQSALERIPGGIVASIGSVCNRARIFCTLQVPKLPSFVAGDREFKPYLTFLSSHDKSAPFVVNLSTVCTVCNNTFSMNLADEKNQSFRVVVKHTKNMPDYLADIPAMLESFYATSHRFQAVFNQLAQIPCTATEARHFFTGFLTAKVEKKSASEVELSSRRLNQIDRLTLLFACGKGNNGQNFADLFSAVTDYYSHESVNASGKNIDGQIEASEFGSGAAMKSLAFVILQDDKRTADLIKWGSDLLTEHEKREAATV